jgi:glyoxylate carboligase
MKGLSAIVATFILVFGTVASRGANLDRISAETGVPVATLQAERASTGLGWGGLEKAHLLANASGQSFDTVVGKFHGGEGWGKIAHDYGLNLGHVVSNARRSGNAAMHAHNAKAMHGNRMMASHGKSATNIGRGHTNRMSTTHHVGHGSSFRSGFSGSHGMHSMSHFGSSRMGSMGHGGRGR